MDKMKVFAYVSEAVIVLLYFGFFYVAANSVIWALVAAAAIWVARYFTNKAMKKIEIEEE